MEGLVAQQKMLSEQLTKMQVNFRKDSKSRKTVTYAKKLLQRVQEIRQSFLETHQKILGLVSDNGDIVTDYFAQGYVGFEELSLNLETDLEELLSEQSAQSPRLRMEAQDCSAKQTDDLDVRLPRITLPKFDGNYSEWTSFKDLFTSLIHRKTNLSRVEKLHYLKSSLSGEAEQLLRHYSITESNYESAWQLLNERYDDKNVLLKDLLKRLLAIVQANESASSIKTLLDRTVDCVQAIENLRIEDKWDAMLMYLTTQRLPSETRQIWEQQQAAQAESPTFAKLKEFMQHRFRALEAAGVGKVKPSRASYNVVVSKEEEIVPCVLCKGAHYVRQCANFLQADYSKRFEIMKRNGLCLNCLNKGHLVGKCPSTSRCRHCKKAHHTLLHKPDALATGKVPYHPPTSGQTNQWSNQSQVNDQQPNFKRQSFSHNVQSSILDFPKRALVQATDVNSAIANDAKTVLLATALVPVQSSSGFVMLRALLDQGSQTSIISESAVQRLGLSRKFTNIAVVGVGNSKGVTANGSSMFKIRTKTNEFVKVNALILGKLTNFVPSQFISAVVRQHIGDLELADPLFDQPGKIDILLGADIYAQVILGEIRKLELGPVLQSTRLGWIISGGISSDNKSIVHSFKIEINEKMEISDQLRRFWEIEEISLAKNTTSDEELCEQHYQNHVQREASGRYQVRLPFKSAEARNSLGNSKASAIASLLHLEKRFAKDKQLQQEYSTVMQEYISVNHMREVPDESEFKFENGERTTVANFLPHHAVYKESTSTKMRVVFDASRKTSSGVSLNDTLLTGPTIQSTMTATIMKWRLNKFAMVADITKMYRQINVHPMDSHFQKIVWRNRPDQPIKTYCLTTVTFGTTSAPFLAIRTLHQLACDEGMKYPKARSALMEEFYVDDLLSGGHTLDESISKREELIKLLKAGGFELRKWIANDNRLLQGLSREDIEMEVPINVDGDNGYKSLGIMWYPLADHFTYKLKLREPRGMYTKRSILSEVARLYDPLGWIAPITVAAKMLLQGLWRSGHDWDEPILGELHSEWSSWLNQLNGIENVRIPRWVLYRQDTILEFHGFCDASKRAYAAAIYLVAKSPGKSSSHLLIAKTKVAPVAPLSIPRLELCGAVLLSRLLKETVKSLGLEEIPAWQWTDSEVVLAWLNGHPSRWTTFVCNRTTFIRQTTGSIPWRYVPSKSNPADVASRGGSPNELVNDSLWWHGPNWLVEDTTEWPKIKDIKSVEVERRKRAIVNVVTHTQNWLDTLLERYSTLTRLVRVTAYCFRVFRRKSPQANPRSYLSSDELQHSLDFWIKYAQQNEFAQELIHLRKGDTVEKGSKLVRLNPAIDGSGIIRMKGRLQNAPLSLREKEPIILPRNGKFTELLLHQIHHSTLHGQTQLMLNTLRKRFWLIDGRSRVKQFVHRCVRCCRAKASGSNQMMGNLPAPRVTISRLFTHTGVDFCGPFDLKDRRGRGSKISKGYVAIFICLAVKAIHIEVVSDLSTSAFLAALRRFMGRRGFCKHIYSDCGTNFVGADAEIRRIMHSSKRVAEIVANAGISWHFNPPASPHFGGLWEAGVRSIKLHLRRVVGNISLTYEEFYTVLVQIEACLNSRPLCPLNDDPTDTTALTPAHFIIGDTIITPSEVDFENVKINCLDRWQMTQKLTQDFWKRWKDEYLNRLHERPKWLSPRTNLKVGDLCLLKDEKAPSYRWPLARITQVHPGNDSLVRVVTVLSNGKTYKRSITKIALLPVPSAVN